MSSCLNLQINAGICIREESLLLITVALWNGRDRNCDQDKCSGQSLCRNCGRRLSTKEQGYDRVEMRVLGQPKVCTRPGRSLEPWTN